MRRTRLACLCFLVVMGATQHRAHGHGFSLSLHYNNGVPASFGVTSQSAYYDLNEENPGPSNLFLEQFGSTPFTDSGGTYYTAIHGFAQTAGAWPAYTATYNILTPLYFADGSSVAAMPAPLGTTIDMFNSWAGNPLPVTDPHPGAAFGDVVLNGKTTFYQGYGVSLYDVHELEKDLYIGGGPRYGEYGYAFNVTVHFANGVTLISPTLVDVFAMSDPNFGDFGSNASVAQQVMATTAIYKAAMSDVNFDGIVNGQDLALVASTWLQTGSIGQLSGDANRDGIVNGQDIALIASNWEAGIPGSGQASAVPEPASLLLALAGALGGLLLSRCRWHTSCNEKINGG